MPAKPLSFPFAARCATRGPVGSKSHLIPFHYIFPVTLEESTTSSQSGTTPEMCKGEISNEKDVEVCDIVLIQSLLSQKLLVSGLIKVNVVNKLRIVALHC